MSLKKVSIATLAFTKATYLTYSLLTAGTHKDNTSDIEAQPLTACSEYVQPQTFAHKNNFLANVVKLRPFTLIGDTDHRYPNLQSYLSDEKTIKAWHKNGVTDIHLEINPHMEKVLEPHINPVFNKTAIEKELQTYIKERGLYALDKWVKLRAKYVTDLITYGHKYGIKIHFISNDSKAFFEYPEMTELYKKYTQADLADCPEETKNKDTLLSQTTRGEQIDFMIYKMIMLNQRLDDVDRIRLIEEKQSGGRQIIIFGDGHFCAGYKNIKMRLGKENATHVSVHIKKTEAENDHCESEQKPDFSYYLETDHAEGQKNGITAQQVEHAEEQQSSLVLSR